ncbi:hypothetical protein [Stenotrophomonas sp. VV52]|uniref:hypothetical protein n=1 Tax=Stenotrophomonas sp. VV52 TaxID=2066958 RepID=UPI000C9E374E|nr:hypothetical protein [Stenotrophomonas sp. VV52]
MADIIPLKFLKTTGGAVVAPSELNPGDSIPSAYIGGLMGSNMLINCGVPVINQRGFAGGALAAGVYGYDRWKAGAGGCNVTINATTGQFTHTSGPLVQVVESPEAAWGVPVTLSVESPSGAISVNIGGATGSITAGAGRRSVTLTPTGTGNMVVQLTATGVTYSQPRLERGAVMTVPEYRSPAAELMLCQRYYEKSYNQGASPGAITTAGRESQFYDRNTSGNSFGTFSFKVSKRSTPAVTLYNDQNGSPNQVASVNGVALAASVTQPGERGASFFYSTAAGQWGASFHWTADAEL